MDEIYKDCDIEKIVDEYEKGGDINLIAKHYKFPSSQVLKKVLKKYYKEERKTEFPENIELSPKRKTEICNKYFGGMSVKELSSKYFKTQVYIKELIAEFKELNSKFTLTIDNIVKDLDAGMNINEIADKYQVTRGAITYHIKKHNVVGIINPKNKRDKIPSEELKRAYLTKNLDKLQNKYGVSATTVRTALKEHYGEDYVSKLKAKLESEIIRLYEDGINVSGIVKNLKHSRKFVSNILNKYYKSQNRKRPKILAKNLFYNAVKRCGNIEEVLAQTKSLNIIVPKAYIEEYQKQDKKSNDELKISDDGWER